MKKFITILFILSSYIAGAQVFTPQTAAGYQNKRTKTDSTNYIPTFCGLPNLRSITPQKQGAIAFDSCNHKFYFYDPKTSVWDTIRGGGGGGGGAFYDSVLMASTKRLKDTASAIRADIPKGGTSLFYDSTSLNFDGTKYIYFSGVTPVDSVSVTAATNLATTNLIQTGNRTYNGNFKTLNFSNFNFLQFQGGTGNAGLIRLDVAATSVNHNASVIINSPSINFPDLTQNNTFTRLLVRDNSFSGKLYWRDVSSITPGSHTHDASDIISGIFPIVRGGTGLNTIGTVGQSLRVASGGTALEYFTPSVATPGWSLTGNSSTNPATNFLGTTDNVGLSFRTNNLLAGGFSPSTGDNTFTVYGPTNSNAYLSGIAGNSTLGLGSYGSFTTIDANGVMTAKAYTGWDIRGNSTVNDNIVFSRAIASGPGNVISARYGPGSSDFFRVYAANSAEDGYLAMGAGVGTGPASTAIANFQSTTKGVLLPRMTETQRNAIAAPDEGTEIYNLNCHCKEYYNGTIWVTPGLDPYYRMAAAMGAPIKGKTLNYRTQISANSQIVSGQGKYTAVDIPKGSIVNGISWYQVTQGVFNVAGAGYNGVALATINSATGLYTIVASSVDDSTTWKTFSAASMGSKAFSTPYTATGGIYIAILIHNSSSQTVAAAIGSSVNITTANAVQSGYTNSMELYGTTTGETTLPATKNASSISQSTSMPYLEIY